MQTYNKNNVTDLINLDKSYEKITNFKIKKKEADLIFLKYPNHIPLYITRYDKSDIPELKKNKFLIPKDFSMSTVTFIIRKKIKLAPDEGLFLFLGKHNVIPSQSAFISDLYQKYKDDTTGLLYVTYSKESSFG